MNQRNEFTYFFNRQRTVRIEKTIVSYLHKPFWQDMLKKSSDKFHGVKFHGFPCFPLTVFIGKLDAVVINRLNAVIGNGVWEYWLPAGVWHRHDEKHGDEHAF